MTDVLLLAMPLDPGFTQEWTKLFQIAGAGEARFCLLEEFFKIGDALGDRLLHCDLYGEVQLRIGWRPSVWLHVRLLGFQFLNWAGAIVPDNEGCFAAIWTLDFDRVGTPLLLQIERDRVSIQRPRD